MTTTFEQILEDKGVLVYTNVGTSMMPLLRQHRDLMVIERVSGPLSRYDVPLYKRPDGKYILHRVLFVRKGYYLITGDNQWRLERVQHSQVLGVLKAVQRDGVTIPISSRKYKWYTHIWCDLYPIRAALFFCRDVLYKIKRELVILLHKNK